LESKFISRLIYGLENAGSVSPDQFHRVSVSPDQFHRLISSPCRQLHKVLGRDENVPSCGDRNRTCGVSPLIAPPPDTGQIERRLNKGTKDIETK
jgi:hypothetical protein